MFFSVFVLPPNWNKDSSISHKLLLVSYPLFYIYLFSGSVLFCCLGRMASEMLIILTKRVEAMKQLSKKGGIVNWNFSIDTWKHQLYRISQLVDNINQFFGPLLLLFITFCFILIINSSFNIMKNVRESNVSGGLVNLFGLSIGFSCFALLIYVPHSMRESVGRVRKYPLLDSSR